MNKTLLVDYACELVDEKLKDLKEFAKENGQDDFMLSVAKRLKEREKNPDYPDECRELQ